MIKVTHGANTVITAKDKTRDRLERNGDEPRNEDVWFWLAYALTPAASFRPHQLLTTDTSTHHLGPLRVGF